MSNSGHNPTTTANRSTTTSGVGHDERQQILLDDLRADVSRLADAVERHNELLADDGAGEEVER
jgi:hypothetical protein